MNDISVIGLDLAKHVFQVHAVDSQGKVVQQKRLRRSQLIKYFTKLKPCLIGLEACGSMHYWARELSGLGHTVKAMAPSFVKPYVKSNKNDRNDAEAICEAVQRPSMRFVKVKTADQQAVLQLHHARQLLVRQRVALSNHIRSVLAEHGHIIARGGSGLARLPEILEVADNGLPMITRHLLFELKAEHDELIKRSEAIYHQLQIWHRSDQNSQLLKTIPGVGLLTATALSAHLGQASGFRNGRQLAAYLGLVPRQASSGGKDRLLGISKRGNRYLRYLLIQGAKTVTWQAQRRLNAGQALSDPWLEGLLLRVHPNKAAVALANKMARISWVLVKRQQVYQTGAGHG